MPIDPAVWDALAPVDRTALRELRGQPANIFQFPLPIPEHPQMPPPDPQVWVRDVFQQWSALDKEERALVRDTHGASFPSIQENPQPEPLDWLKLFVFAAAHSVGWSTATRARAFVEWAEQQNILGTMVEHPPQLGQFAYRPQWMEILEQQADNPHEDHDYSFRVLFAQMHRMVLKLQDYSGHLLAFNLWPNDGHLPPDWIENPQAFPNLPDHINPQALPPLRRVFGPTGCVVLLRELQRLGHLNHPGFSPYGFVPRGRLLRKLQLNDDQRGLQGSANIHQMVQDSLLHWADPALVAAFLGDFDLPLQWALDH